MSTTRGLVVIASHVGHVVHRDDPELVLRLVSQIIATPAGESKK